jgi:hypothetical protein
MLGSIVQGPTIHAFAHALSNILEYLRRSLAKCPPSLVELSTGSVPISGIWLHYEVYWETLVSLAVFCGRVCHTMALPWSSN